MAGKAAKGTLLKVGDGGGSETFTTVPGITSISGPSMSLDVVDVSDMSSTWKEYDNALIDGGEIQCSGNFISGNAVQNGLQDDFIAGTLRNFQVVWIDGPTTWTVPCFITSWEPGGEVNGKLTLSFTLKISGTVTIP